MTNLKLLDEVPKVTYYNTIAGDLVGIYRSAADALLGFPKDEPRARMVAEIECRGQSTYREVMPRSRTLVSRLAF
jgi:hypothetical protein